MYIPDLFGAYTKGRELAIEKNWQDLKNFESVEAQRNQNDLTAMDIWESRQQMPGKMNMFYNNVDTTQMNTDLTRASHRGLKASADMQSDVAVGQYGIYKAHEPRYLQAVSDGFIAKVDEQANAAKYLSGRNAYIAPIAYSLGGLDGETEANRTKANNILGDNLQNTANYSNAISNSDAVNALSANELQHTRIKNAIELAPLTHANNKDAISRTISERDGKEQQINATTSGELSPAEIGSMYAAALGDPAAQEYYLLEQAGKLPAGTIQRLYGSRLGMTQDLMGTGRATTTVVLPQGATPNGMPVQQFSNIGNTVGGGATTRTVTVLPQGATPNGMPVQQFSNIGNTVRLLPNTVGVTGGSGSRVINGQIYYY